MNNCETLEAMNNQIFLCESSPKFERPKNLHGYFQEVKMELICNFFQ